jgi:hypothetical protein
MAALHAAKFYRDLGFFYVILEGDSLSVIKDIEEKAKLAKVWAYCG